MQLEPTVAAYLAGVIDSDGFITIQRSRHAAYPDKVYYGAQVGISGTRSEPHDLASSLFGGKVSSYTPKNPKHRVQHQWSRIGRGAVPVIEAVRPYLRIKQEQADLALCLQEHVEDGRCEEPYPWFGPDYDPDVHSRLLWAQVVDLNQSRRRLRSNATA